MLTTSCGWCRLQLHCPVGSKSYRDLEAKIKTGIDPAPLEIAAPLPRKVTVNPPQAAPVALPAILPAPSEKTIFDIFS